MTRKVLNVDDDVMVRTLVREILQSAEYEVVSAPDAFEALRLLEGESAAPHFSCIVLDVEMPGMNGLDLLTRLKLHANTQNIPVIMLTCQASPEDFMTGYNIGASYYITKPFTREQLLFGIELVTENGAEEPER
jgi:DNA-binding response OmpR family regulator